MSFPFSLLILFAIFTPQDRSCTLPKDSKTYDVVFRDVVQMPGQGQDSLFSKAGRWFFENYDDFTEQGKSILMGEGVIELEVKIKVGDKTYPVKKPLHYNLKTEFRDGMYRYHFFPTTLGVGPGATYITYYERGCRQNDQDIAFLREMNQQVAYANNIQFTETRFRKILMDTRYESEQVIRLTRTNYLQLIESLNQSLVVNTDSIASD